MFEVAANNFWHSTKLRGEVKSGNKIKPCLSATKRLLPGMNTGAAA
jgi:hypothetical protein